MMVTRKEIPKNKLWHRSLEIDKRAIDEESRTVELAFSSEFTGDRWYGTETLSHERSAVRLDRINNGGALLLEHDRNDQIGVVERAWIDDDKKGRARVKFSKSARGEEIFQDVKDGIRQLVSVGYVIHGEETQKLDGGREAVTATDWEPYELSLVSIPFDDSVGVGRKMENETTDQINTTKPMSDTIKDQADKATPPEAQKRSVEVINERPAVDAKKERETAISAERSRIARIQEIAEASKSRGIVLDANKAIERGTDINEFQSEALAAFTSRHTDYTPANDLSKSEKRDLAKFDLSRALQSCIGERKLEGIEKEIVTEGFKEASEAGIKRGGGIMLPGFYVNRAQRDMTATGGTGGDQGGMTVATEKAGLLDDFYNANVLAQSGATVLTGLTSNLDVPRLIAGSDPAGKAENATADEIAPTTAQLELSPQRLPGYVNISKQLIMQSNSAIEAIVRSNVTAQMLAVQEAAFFHGTGTNEAEGIAGTNGIGSVVGGPNGAAPDWEDIVDLEEAVDAQNALGGNLYYFTNGQIKKKLKETPLQGLGVEGAFIIPPNTRNGEIELNGYRTAFTNAISRTLDQGNATGVCSAIFFGNASDYFIGYWGGLMLDLVSDATLATQGLYRLVGETYYDGGVQRPKSFAAMLDALGA